MIRRRFKNFMPERLELSKNGDEQLLSVSEYYGVKPRSEAFEDQSSDGRAATLEGYRIVRRGDFVMNYMLAWKGAYGVSEHDGIVSPAYAVFQIDHEVADRRYIHYRLRAEFMRSEFRARSKGIIESRLRLYPDAFLAMHLELPSIHDQKSVADFLECETVRIDSLVEKKEHLIQKVQERFKSRTQKFVSEGTVHGRKLTKTSNRYVQYVPDGWKAVRLKHLFRMLPGYAFKSEYFRTGEPDLPVLITPGSFNPNGGIYEPRDTDVRYAGEIDDRFRLRERDLVVAMTDLSYKKLILGQCDFVPRGDFLLNQRIARIEQLRSDVVPSFLRFAINAGSSREQVKLTATGATVFHSSADKIRETLIGLPSTNEQQEISKILTFEEQRAASTTRVIATSISRLREFKAALINAAISGQIKMPERQLRKHIEKKIDRIEESMQA